MPQIDAEKIKRELREAGFMIRMTEWHDGFQCAAFHRSNPHKVNSISPWKKTEEEGWLEVRLCLDDYILAQGTKEK